MIPDFDLIEKAYEARDLKALDALATPRYRKINKKRDYRSVLMLSCNHLKHLLKIDSLKTEAITLNLEDAVSKEDKPFALVLCAIFLAHHAECDKKLIVRVNALSNGGYEEIAYLNQFMPDAIRVPKVRSKEEVESVCKLLNDGIELHLSIETKEAWLNFAHFRVDKKVTAFFFGILDLLADLELSQNIIKRDNPTMRYMLAHFLTICKAIGVKPVSFVIQDYKDLGAFKEWLVLEREMGYHAKACTTPAQTELVNQFFIDAQKEIERAKVIVKLFEMHQAEGITGFSDDEYGFIDEPIYKGALVVLHGEKLD